MIEHQRPLLPQSSFVIRRSPMVGNMARQSHMRREIWIKPGLPPWGRTSASVERRHWSGREVLCLGTGCVDRQRSTAVRDTSRQPGTLAGGCVTAHLERSKRRDVIDADPNSVREIASLAISNLEAANDCSRTLIGGPVVLGTVNLQIAG